MILITGATGHVGSELITALLPTQAGHIRALLMLFSPMASRRSWPISATATELSSELRSPAMR